MRPREHSHVRGHYTRFDPAAGLSRSVFSGSEVTRAYYGGVLIYPDALERVGRASHSLNIFRYVRTGTRAEFSTEFPTGEQCHVFPKLCLSYDELLGVLTS